MKQPPGFVDSSLPSHVCRLHKSLYGLKQAPRAWYTRLSDFLLSIGFQASKVDTSLFILSDGTNIFYLLVYVDDILLTGSNSAMLHHLIQLLSSEFKLRDLGAVHYFLGIEVQSTGMGLMLRQHKYIITRGSSFALHGFTDADWAGSIDDRKSTGGYLVFFGQTPISWKSGKQRTVARSSIEAEYKALADGTAEVIWLQYLLTDLQVPSVSAPTIWCDNLGATYLSANPIFHARTKHVKVDYHFIHDRVAKKEIQIRFVPSWDQLAYVFTKPLPVASFTAFRFKLRVDPSPSA